MGSIIGGVIGAAGSLFGGSSTKSADKKAAQQALTGYNYLTSGGGAPTIQGAQTAGATATAGMTGTQSAEAQLLGTQPLQAGTKNAFNNYLNSTGYNFQLDSGERAITGSAAARGLLNSGATAKALTSYGQNLGSSYFNNYLDQLGGLNNQQTTTAGQGITATTATGAAGSTGGGNASTATQAGGAAMGNGITTAAGAIGGQATNLMNFFGSI